MLEEHHPVEPLLFSPRTVNYTENANTLTDCGMYSTVFALGTVAVLTCMPELQNITIINVTESKKCPDCTNSGLYNSKTDGEAKLTAMWCHLI